MSNSTALGGKKKYKNAKLRLEDFVGRNVTAAAKKEFLFNLEVLQVILKFFVLRFKKPILPNKKYEQMER